MTFAARADIMRDALHRKHGANSDESNAIPAETDDGTIRKISIRDACQRAPPGANRTRVPHSLSMSEYPAQLDSRNLCVKINLVARDDPSVAAYADKSGLAYPNALSQSPRLSGSCFSNRVISALSRIVPR